MDLINYIAQRATRKFGGSDGVFNAVCFGSAWSEVTGIKGGLDGHAVKAMLHGRRDVVREAEAHWRLSAPVDDARGGKETTR